MLQIKRFLGHLVTAGALLTGATGLAGCGPTYRTDVSVWLSSKSDVSVDVADVPVSLQVLVSIICSDHDPSGDPVPCGTEYPPITSLRLGRRGAEVPVPADGILGGYTGGTLNLIAETADHTYERELELPWVHTFTVEPALPVLTEPFTVRWTPHGQPGMIATIGASNEAGTEWTNSLAGEGDDGEEVVNFTNLPDSTSFYRLEMERGNACQDCDPVTFQESDAAWSILASVVRTMEVPLPPVEK